MFISKSKEEPVNLGDLGIKNATFDELLNVIEAWTKYLTTAARLYKYPFQEQMLIFAQRPEATARTSIEIWYENMNCWVNKDAKGIALIDEEADKPRLKYVFDMEDVHKARRIGRDPYLWEMREEHKEAACIVMLILKYSINKAIIQF